MHGPCLSLAGADGIGNAGSGIGVARPATCMQGMRPAMLHPPSPPGDSSAGTARRASRGCRQVFGLMDAASANRCLLGRGFPGSPSQCQLRPRLHLPLRGSAGMGATSLDERRTGFPFHPVVVATGTDDHNILGHRRCVNGKMDLRAMRKQKAGRSPLSGVTPMAPAITRPCLRPRPRPSSTGGCGPACRLPAP